jgi:acetylglutamate kinase
LEQLRTEIDQNIRDGKQNIVKLAAALIALEESNSQLRNQLKANTTHLQLFLKSIQDYEQKLTNNWQMKMLLETAKSQIQTLVKSFDLINYRLNKLLRND